MNTTIMKFLSIILIFSAVYAFADTRLTEFQENALLNDISSALNEVDTLKADFSQVRTLWVFDDKLITEGICYFANPDKLRWEIRNPFNTILIYNSGQIAKFENNNGELTKYNLGTEEIMRIVLSEIIYWMKGDFEQAKELYDLSILDSSNYIIELAPRSVQMKNIISRIELEISRSTKHILKVSIIETQNDSIVISFFNEVNNISFNKNLFNTDNPDN